MTGRIGRDGCRRYGRRRGAGGVFGPSEDELAQAKRHIIGGFPLRLDSNLKLMGYVSMLGQYDLPNEWLNRYPDKVAAVTLAQVRDAWKRRLSLAALSQVRVGPRPAP